MTAAFVLATYAASPTDPELFLLYDNGMVRILVVVLCIAGAMHFHDLYSDLYVKSRILLLQQLCMVAGIAFLLQGLISYVLPGLDLPLLVMAVGCPLAILVIFVWRIVFNAYVLEVVGRDRVLLVGAAPLLAEIARHMQEHPEKGSQVIGYVTGESPPGTLLAGGAVLGGLAELREIVEATRPNRIVVGAPEGAGGLPVAELLDLRYGGQAMEEAASAYEKAAGRVCLKALRPDQLIASGEYGPRSQDVLYQTAANRLLAFVGMVVALPLMLAAAVAVRLSSRGTGPEPAHSRGAGRPAFHALQVPLHARPGGRGRDLGAQGRSAGDPGGPDPAIHPRGRAAAVVQRAARRHGDSRSAPRAAGLRGEADGSDSLLSAAACGAAGNHRLGADQPGRSTW